MCRIVFGRHICRTVLCPWTWPVSRLRPKIKLRNQSPAIPCMLVLFFGHLNEAGPCTQLLYKVPRARPYSSVCWLTKWCYHLRAGLVVRFSYSCAAPILDFLLVFVFLSSFICLLVPCCRLPMGTIKILLNVIGPCRNIHVYQPRLLTMLLFLQ